MRKYDYIILGSGIAGLYDALLAHEAGTVLILTKGGIDECNTKHAQGGIAAAISSLDSPELHYQDTIDAGAGLCDPEAVHILTEEALDRISDLVKLGVPFDTVNGEIALTKEAAHSTPRILHAGGDLSDIRSYYEGTFDPALLRVIIAYYDASNLYKTHADDIFTIEMEKRRKEKTADK